ncbi:hypothetical protein L9Z42_14665 [Clostridioides difficile]|nr:hypothetical protein [Clostridioides difficile]
MFGKKNFNVEFPRGIKVRNVATKIGALFGEEGAEIGRVIDEATKNVTIKFESESDDEDMLGLFKIW